jgi:bacterioferritin-associated ferredoxin
MYVCICNAVNDRCIAAAIRCGATTVEAIGQVCDAGTCCGTCRPELERMIAENRLDRTGQLQAT